MLLDQSVVDSAIRLSLMQQFGSSVLHGSALT